jgi:DNA-binding NarL/FixJ family response regulator
VVLAHRSQWFLAKVTSALEAAGLTVVARLSNGADAVGVAVAEQPDLLPVEDNLCIVTGEEVVREVRRFSPHTAVAAQVPYGDSVGRLLDAGAVSVFTRQVPPADVAHALLQQMRASKPGLPDQRTATASD